MSAQLLFQSDKLEIYWLGLQPYESTFASMKAEVQARLAATEPAPDQLWLLHHEPVYTLGTRGQRTGLIGSLTAPVVKADRGGDVTYHGPGQLVGYPVVQLNRLGLSGAGFVHALESLIVGMLQEWDLQEVVADPNRPGVYVLGQKIASLGLRCKRRGQRQVSYHGFALNVDMDLSPFSQINPCGYAGQMMTQLSALLQSAKLAKLMKVQKHQEGSDNTLDHSTPISLVHAVATQFAQRFGSWHADALIARESNAF
jgi:lipoyl(octanoyl) transferase